MHKSRPFRVWSSGEWCWFWRARAHLHRRTKASRQFKEGAFLGAARVLLQEREGKGDDLKCKAVVWVVDGDQLVRCSSTHLRPVSTAEQTLCLLRDGPQHVLQSYNHPLFHSHRLRNHQRYHRQLHHHIWNYLQSQCLSLEQ